MRSSNWIGIERTSLWPFMYPCLYYVMARTGCATLGIGNFLEIPKKLPPEDPKKLKTGMVLYWENNEGEKNWQLTIGNNGKVVETATYNRGHYAVYEGDGLISDLSWNNDTPYIRLRKLSDLHPCDSIIIPWETLGIDELETGE